MKQAIIHISDLHICEKHDLKGNPTSASNRFRLNTVDTDFALAYIDRFCEKVGTQYGAQYELTLLITGDITDTSSIDENNKAKILLERIMHKLNIKPQNLILLPGDHDINRVLSREAFANGKKGNPTKQSYEYNEKYDNFKNLYAQLKELDFDSTKAIVSYKVFQNGGIYLLGLNTNYKIDYEGGVGFISYESLSKEIGDLQIPETASIIVAFHHNIFTSYEENQVKSWDLENRKLILDYLKSIKVKCILHGNEHTRGNRVDGAGAEDLLFSSDVGCFASITPSPSFKIYEIVSDAKGLRLKNNIYKNINENNINTNNFWSLQTSTEVGETEFFELQIKPSKLNYSDFSIINDSEQSQNYQTKNKEIQVSNDFRNGLLRIVKQNKIFHSGHFHWSETSRAHNWIDVTKILKNHNDLNLAKNGIIDLISKNIIDQSHDIDFIIGLGIEGNILSTKASIKWNRPYSFLPYSYRYDDHNKFEKDLCFENNGRYKNVLIITDVVNDGRTIRKLIQKREKLFFENVENIFVVSLFYTGEQTDPDSSILNLSAAKIVQDKIIGDHPEHRIEYFFLLNLKVEKCPYGENYRDECLVMKENLGCVYRFYDEEKAKKKKET